MTRRWRWAVVAAVTAVLAALPAAVQLLPVASSPVSASTLLARIKASGSVPWSGYAQSQGGLALPVSGDQFGSVSDLFGGTSQLRVWWRGTDDWRVDALDLTGESDIRRDRTGVWTWDYESNTARHDTDTSSPSLRLPRSDDLVPANLARRLLSEIGSARVTRLPTARIAGHTAAGLRVHITDSRSTITHIDVWALASAGLPLRVSVYGAGATPLVTTTLLDLSLGTPSASDVAFHPASSAKVSDNRFGDIVSAIDNFGDSRPPASLAGLPRRHDLDLGAVGVYGTGVTVVALVPLPANLAGQVVPSLRATAGAVEDALGISAQVGALSLQVSAPVGYGDRWLLVGTVTSATLRAAVATLPAPSGFGSRTFFVPVGCAGHVVPLSCQRHRSRGSR